MDKYCPECGSPLNGGEKFCGNCGTSLNLPAMPQAGIPNSASEQSRTVKDSASDQSKILKKVVIQGLSFAILLTIMSGPFMFILDIYDKDVVVGSKNGFMILGPNPTSPLSISEFFILFVIAWLGYSISVYFMEKKKYFATEWFNVNRFYSGPKMLLITLSTM